MPATLRPGLLRTALAMTAGVAVLVPLAPVAAASPADRQHSVVALDPAAVFGGAPGAAAPADPVSDLLAALTGGDGEGLGGLSELLGGLGGGEGLGGLQELLGGLGGLGGLGDGLGGLGDLSLLQALLGSIVDIDPSALEGEDPDFGGAFGPADRDLGDLLKALLAQVLYELLTAVAGDDAPAQP